MANLSEELEKEFPFARRKEECKTPYALFGVECGPGWGVLLRDTFQKITVRCVEEGNTPEQIPIEIIQIKGKFGSLRIYHSFNGMNCGIHAIDGPDGHGVRFYPTAPQEDAKRQKLLSDIERYIEAAESESTKCCEECGRTGTLRTDLPWIKMLCDSHYAEARERQLFKRKPQ